MRTQLDVLVVENRRHAADEAVAALEAAGHHVHRCFERDNPGFPCVAVVEPDACPIDRGIDVTLAVRDRVEPRPTRYEVGVSCAIRSGLPLAELGTEALDPFEPWVTCRAGDDVVAAVETAADRGFDELRTRIASRIARVVPPTVDSATIHCAFERHGRRLIVRLSGPEVGDRVEQALSVRVLDAVWHAHRTQDQVDVSYQVTVGEEGVTATLRPEERSPWR